MAKLILAFDKQGWELSDERITGLVNSGVDAVKLTAAALFSGVYDTINDVIYDSVTEEGNYTSCKPVPIFLDLKVADISFGCNKGTNYKIVEAISRDHNAVDAISIHGFMGLDAIQEAVAASVMQEHRDPIKIMVLCAMTDPMFSYYFDEGDTHQFIHWAKDAHAHGVILPANRLRLIQQAVARCAPDVIWSPGFGRQDPMYDSIYDQLEAWRDIVGNNPDHAAIVGTHLLDQEDVQAEVSKIKDLID